MAGTFGGLQIASRALQASQAAINVVGHNVANVNTPGYTRQTIDLTASDPYTVAQLNSPVSAGQVGTGVDVTSINRIRNGFLENQLQSESSSDGCLTQMRDTLAQVEALYSASGTSGISGSVTSFFNSFQDLANDPESATARLSVRTAGETMAQQFNQVNDGLTSLQTDAQNSLKSYVNQANSLSKQVADLNNQIKESVAAGDNPNDLMDKRDVIVKQLGTLVGGQAVDEKDASGQPTGAVNVSVGGTLIVDGAKSFDLPTDYTTLNGVPQLVGVNGNIVLANGQASGAIQSENLIKGYMSDLNSIASTIIAKVNEQHSAGYGLDGTTGVNFFTGTGASDMAVSQTIEGSLDSIAAASAPVTGQTVAVGNGDNALYLSDIANSALFGSSTISEKVAAHISQVGTDSANYQQQTDNNSSLMKQTQSLRDSVSGVSLDEELTSMLQYQRSYQAAARVLNTMDTIIGDMITTLMP